MATGNKAAEPDWVPLDKLRVHPNNPRIVTREDVVDAILSHWKPNDMATVTVKLGGDGLEKMCFALKENKFTGEYVNGSKINWLRDWMPISILPNVFDIWGVQEVSDFEVISGADFFRAADLDGFHTPVEDTEEEPKIDVGLAEYTGTECIYFVQAETMGLIKIGTSNNVASRIGALRTGCPDTLNVLAVVPGDCNIERALHKKFSNDRTHGEWFRPSEGLLSYIKEVTQ